MTPETQFTIVLLLVIVLILLVAAMLAAVLNLNSQLGHISYQLDLLIRVQH